VNITIKINTDNAAFEDANEIRRVIEQTAEKVANRVGIGWDPARSHYDKDEVFTIRDNNGNAVGTYQVEESPST